MADDTEDVVPFATVEDWRAWLDEHHDARTGVWLKLAKKASGIETVTYAQAVEVALCYGWIDGQSKSVDETWWTQRFTPRRKRSKWSKINTGRATELIDAGLMQPAGLREVEAAKADGRWDAAYAGPRTATVPDDLAAALAAKPRAKAAFEAANSTNRFAILHRVQDAKKPETRARRIEKLVAMLDEGKLLYP
jgi:uncharacterized protein YdeI (YjbR/CyaY-like superfamily)